MHTKNNIWKHNIAVCMLNKYRTTDNARILAHFRIPALT